jgi:membrane protein
MTCNNGGVCASVPPARLRVKNARNGIRLFPTVICARRVQTALPHAAWSLLVRSLVSLHPHTGISRKLRAITWWQIALLVTNRLGRHNAELLAAGIAMYGLLSVFPGLTALVFIYGLFATPVTVQHQMQVFAGVLPPGVWGIFSSQLQNVAAHDHGTLTAAAAVGLLIALWSARLTMSGLMSAINIAYEESEKRGVVAQILISLALTLAAIIGFLAMLLLGVIVPVTLAVLGASAWHHVTVSILRWLLLWAFAASGLSLVYRYAPAHRRARWRCVTWGSAVAATFWLAVSGLFTLYVRWFGHYDQTYGMLAAVVVLLMWFYLLSFVVVLGAEINAAMERLPLTCRRGGT